MKDLPLTLAAALLTVTAFGQGTVFFYNASSVPWWNPVVDRNVKFGPSIGSYDPRLIPGANVSSNFAGVNLASLRAALYYAPGVQTDILVFAPAGGGSTTFRASTSSVPGSWFGGTRTLMGVRNGELASLFVVVWDSSLSTDPLSAAARTGIWGTSAIFQYSHPSSPTPAPSDFMPQNLSSFVINPGPEPSTFALAALSFAALLVLHQRRRS